MNASITSTAQTRPRVPCAAEAHSWNRQNYPALLAGLGFAAFLLVSAPTFAQVAPPLGLVTQFGALGGAGGTGQAGAGSIITGDVGSSPTRAISNFPPSTVVPPFFLHLTNDGVVQQAQIDATTAYNALAAQGPGTVLPAQLGGTTLTTGVYSFTGGAADIAAGTTLTLNGPGVFVFNVASTVTGNVLSNVVGTANPCTVSGRVGPSATLNGNNFWGTVIALASVTANGAVTGRAVARTAAVTMPGGGGTTIGGCSAFLAGPGAFPPLPTLSEWAMVMLAALLALAGFVAMRRQAR